MAMEARAYTGGEGRTAYTVLRSTWQDCLAPLAALAFSFWILRAPFPF